MKKLLCVFTCLLFLAGCTNFKTKENEARLPEFAGFKADVYTIVNEVKISAYTEYLSVEGLILTFSLPLSVKGLCITCQGEEILIRYNEIETVLNRKNLPYSMLCNCIYDCAENSLSAVVTDGCATFVLNNHRYELYVEDETMNFQKLVTDNGCTVYFENFEYLWALEQ